MRYWMLRAFRLTSDPTELRELLDVCQLSIASFIEATVAELCRTVRNEREQLKRGADPAIREVVAQIIDGATPPANAEGRLGYVLSQQHTAAVLWSDQFDVNDTELDRVARALMDAAGGRQAFLMRADAATRWLWFSGRGGPQPSSVAAVLGQLPGIRIAFGPTASGVDGFRRSHLDALTTQRMMAQAGFACRISRYTDIELIALLLADPQRTDQFVERTLGNFASADVELRRTVLTYIDERCSASRTAARLFIHRNTLHARLAQANELLPQPLEKAHLRVAVALETLGWMRRESNLRYAKSEVVAPTR